MSQDADQITEEEWMAAEREKLITYLGQQGCQHGGVGEWPVFHAAPYIALWAVQSLKAEGRIGWWAISGDVPTDYMSSSSGYHPRDAMRYLSSKWLEIADGMSRGTTKEGCMIGTPDQWPRLAPLLRSRAKLIRNYADDDDLWTE